MNLWLIIEVEGYTEESGFGRSQRDFLSLLAGADPQEKLEVDMGIRAIHDFQMLKQQKAAQEERQYEI